MSLALVIQDAMRMRLWPVWIYRIFQYYAINGTIFEGKKLCNVKCVLWFSLGFVRNISRSEENLARYYHKCAQVFP